MRATTYPIGTSIQLVLGPGDVGGLLQADSTNSADIYLGGDTVTPDATGTGGFRLLAGISLPVELIGDDQLYAVSALAGQLLRVVQGTRTRP